ncbi:MAG TPA: hypothetical protein VMW17_18890 [Candidatus Binatia bacterium]|nr:hypothetical protein [Candidatus Binatia bacterium]
MFARRMALCALFVVLAGCDREADVAQPGPFKSAAQVAAAAETPAFRNLGKRGESKL